MELSQMSEKIELSVIVPVYNSARIFPVLCQRIINALSERKINFEIIAVADGCQDDSVEVISKINKNDSRIKLIEFSRNFGHQAAITAGLSFASGEMVTIMDDDLEDPPELLPQFIDKANEGYDVVYGIRKKRKVSFYQNLLFKFYYRFSGCLIKEKIPYDAGDFCLIKRSVVNILNSMPETNRYLRGMRSWLGFRQTGIPYERGERFSGESGYTFNKYFSLAFDGLFSFSYRPLILLNVFGFIIFFSCIIISILLISLKLTGNMRDVPGWLSLMLSILFMGSIQLISVGILGQYIARIYDEVKRRPNYVVKKFLGFD